MGVQADGETVSLSERVAKIGAEIRMYEGLVRIYQADIRWYRERIRGCRDKILDLKARRRALIMGSVGIKVET
jgi:hypothetical protein